MQIKIKWFNSLIRGLAAFPATVKGALILNKGGKVLDKAADDARARRSRLIEDIRRSGTMSVLCLILALSGCTSAKMLRAEGYELSRWQRAQLAVYDCLIVADEAKDYEITIGIDDATPTGTR